MVVSGVHLLHSKQLTPFEKVKVNARKKLGIEVVEAAEPFMDWFFSSTCSITCIKIILFRS